MTDIAIYSNLLDELNNNLCSYKNIVDSIMDTEAEDSCETDLEAEVDKEIKEEEIVIILCIYSQIKSIKLHVISISYILLRRLLCLYK